jgi:hypothetical protein
MVEQALAHAAGARKDEIRERGDPRAKPRAKLA